MIGATYNTFNEPIKVSTDLPIPHPSSDGVVVKIMATGVCRSDWHGWRGHDDDVKQFLQANGTPFIPGHEASGVVVEVGLDVRNFRVGDRVAIPFILSCGKCRECGDKRRRPTVCEDQHQPGFTMHTFRLHEGTIKIKNNSGNGVGDFHPAKVGLSCKKEKGLPQVIPFPLKF